MIMATAYCMKCRDKVGMKNPTKVTMKNGFSQYGESNHEVG